MSETQELLTYRILPTPSGDNLSQAARGDRYGETFVSNVFGTSDHILAGEGSYMIATNTTVGTGQTWVAAQTAFADTTPNWYIQNNENPANGSAKSLHFRFLKMISTAVATSTSLIRYAAILDPVARTLSTDNTATITPTCFSGNVSPTSLPLIKVQNSATASVITASSAAKRLLANGTLGGLNVVGTEFQINFGSTDAGGGQNGVAAETIPNRRVNNEGPIIVGPGQNVTIHVWLVGSSASPAPEWTLGFVMR